MRPKRGSRLSGPLGNNAFVYAQRKITEPEPKLRIPAFETILTTKHIALGSRAVFAELDQDDQVILYTGLKKAYQLLGSSTTNQLPLADSYIFDNHNYALYFWTSYLQTHPEQCGDILLIHIDQHSDLGQPPPGLRNKSVLHYSQKEIFYYATNCCHVGNFIRPLLDTTSISRCIWIKNQYDLEQFVANIPSQPYLLDIDLDFRAPGMESDLTTTIPLVKDLLLGASCTTIASSPYFLKQSYALELLDLLLEQK